MDVGLGYLTLDRTAATLSGGEAQRIRLATQIGCGLVGVLYILDEPTHRPAPARQRHACSRRSRLRDLGNTVIVVEHDEETMRAADYLVDIGPGAGRHGGEVVASGTLDEDRSTSRSSLTGQYLSAASATSRCPSSRRTAHGKSPDDHGAREQQSQEHRRRRFPLGTFICVTGVCGSGKSLADQRHPLSGAGAGDLCDGQERPGDARRLNGLEHLDKVIDIDQSPIGRTPRSNPATYIKAVRRDPQAVRRSCPRPSCAATSRAASASTSRAAAARRARATGSKRIEMQFLADVWVPCDVCDGHALQPRDAARSSTSGKNIADVLDMAVEEALEFFEHMPRSARMLQTLHDVGLDYIKLGQPATTLSGGEAQRVKLANELARRATGRTLYILDEPTTGLHFADIERLLHVLHRLVDAGNTVLVIEHNLDVIKTADWIIDLGPEGGDGGGQVVATARPRRSRWSMDRTRVRFCGRYCNPSACSKLVYSVGVTGRRPQVASPCDLWPATCGRS